MKWKYLASMLLSIDSIFTHLPDDLLIYPGHEYLKRNLEFTNHFEPQNIKAQEFLNKIADLNLDNIFFIRKSEAKMRHLWFAGKTARKFVVISF